MCKLITISYVVISFSYIQVNKSSRDFWSNLNMIWEQCADVPCKCWVTSVAELDGNVYATILDSRQAHDYPLKYDFSKDQWFSLPALPYTYYSLVTVPELKKLLAIGGTANNDGVHEFSNKVFLWDEKNKKWTTPYPNMPTA